MTVKQYDPAKILITFGAIPISGFAPGTFLKIDASEDAFTLQVGADGEACRTRTNNNSGSVEISLLQSSRVNDLLSQQHELDKISINGLGCVPLLIKDLQGGFIASAQKAWIRKRPSAEFGDAASARTWVIDTDDLRVIDAGS